MKNGIEGLVEARAIPCALHDHGGDRIAHGLAGLEAHRANRANRVDGLRRRDGKARPTEHPEELVGHAKRCAHVGHRA